MKLFEYIDRINLLNKLIKEKKTGNPACLAKRLSISTSRLYVILDDLKLRGAPIGYSRELQSYFYNVDFDIEINATFKLLDQEELENVSAGAFFANYSPLLFL